MNIYLDYIFIENFSMTFIILLETAYLTRKNTVNIRVIIASLISSIYVCIMLFMKIQEMDYFLMKILLNVIVLSIAFNISYIKELIKINAVFYTVVSVNIGVNIFISQMFKIPINSLKSKAIIYTGGIIFGYLIFKWLWKIYKNNITEKDCIYKVMFEVGGETFNYRGFLDTGNSSKDLLSNKFVLFAKQKDNIQEYIQNKDNVEIDIVTINNQNKIKGVIIKNIKVKIKNEITKGDAIIVFDDTNLWDGKKFDMILNYEFMKEIGGIRI